MCVLLSSRTRPGAHEADMDADMDGDPTLVPDPLDGVRRCADERAVGVGGNVADELVCRAGAVGTGGAWVVGVMGVGVVGVRGAGLVGVGGRGTHGGAGRGAWRAVWVGEDTRAWWWGWWWWVWV